MKITQYFTSPSKEFMKNMVENSDTLKNSGNKNVNIEDKKENSTGDKSESMGTSKKQKRRKRRVPSDPIVKDVIALLSNKLSLVSPNSSVSEKSPVSFSQCVNTGENNEISSNIPIDNSEDQRKSEETVSRLSLLNVNAFQFMMNSRNNVIGQNSGGKEAPVEQSTSIEEKNKLASRKNLFKNWANQKGAMKRKRDEDEIECCINYKMGKRARRLKKMIQNNTQVEAEKLEVVKPQRKKVRRIPSESESSNDGRLVSGCVPSQLGKTDLKGTDEECVKNSENNIKNDKVQNNLLNFVALKKNKGDVVVFDSDANTTNSTQTPIIKIKMFTRKSSKKKASKVTEPDKDELAINIDTNSPKFNLQSTSKLNLEDINDGSNSYPSSPRRSLRVHRKTLNYSEMDIKVSDTKSKKTKKSENMNSLNTSGIPNKLATVFMPRSSSENNVKINKTSKVTVKANTKQPNCKNKNNSNLDIQEISDSESEGDSKKKLVKVAPLFLKANARPKLDKETIEARKQFLMSGIPESLKKTVEKQKSMEERVYNIFPSNSHIQQKCDNPYWNLSRPERSFLEDSELHVSKIDCTNLIKKETFSQPNFIMSGKLHNIKHHLDDIKTENPNYPVYKVFKYIYENRGHLIKKAAPKTSPRKKAKKENRLSTDEFTNVNENSTSKKYELWTEKYKPKTSEHILGNKKVVTSLKNWLETWMNYSKEINSRVKRLQEDANSESEFDFTDCDSRDSTRILSNTMILIGPCGSGKTSAVYTIANELGFNVLEVNSSSRRTGKKIIQELQEATQSHQVRKKGIIASSSQHEHIKIKEKRSKKMCILLVEDIDLVFEQDEGFLSSLYQLITTSKRPIILTTTDTTPLHVQKLLNQHECIVFRPIYKEILGVWLQIVCLVEGLLVDKNDISSLLDYYKGDVRKSLLSAQFWCQSGGQLNRDVFISFLTVPALPESSLLDTVDDDVKISPEQSNENDCFVHMQSLTCFEICHQYRLPYGLELGKIWWNIPSILNMPNCFDRLYRNGSFTQNIVEDETDNSSFTSAPIDSLLTFYDSLILADELNKSMKCNTEEPIVNSWRNCVRDSSELTDREEDISEYVNLTCDMTHTLINGCVQGYQDMYNIRPKIDLTAPNSIERRWRVKQHGLEHFLKQAVPTTNLLERSAVAIDYLPALRHIARSEDKRATTNTKRGNRFRHYFRSLNMEFNANKSKLCCNVLYLPNAN